MLLFSSRFFFLSMWLSFVLKGSAYITKIYGGCKSDKYIAKSFALQDSKAPMSFPQPPSFTNFEEERLYCKQRMAAAFRLFSKLGYDEGVAGHITARDPEHRDTFWINQFGMDYSEISVSKLIRVNEEGEVIEGRGVVPRGGFAIHSRIHMLRPDANAAVHTHSPAGRSWSTLGRLLDPITQDVLPFYQDHSLYNDFGRIAFDVEEGYRIAAALGPHKAVIMRNHGLLTVGRTVDEAAWWYVALERSCLVQLQAESTGARAGLGLQLIPHEAALAGRDIIGTPSFGWLQFQPMYERIIREQPDLLL